MAETLGRAVQANARENGSTVLLAAPRPIYSARTVVDDVVPGTTPGSNPLAAPQPAQPTPVDHNLVLRVVSAPFTVLSQFTFGPDTKTISIGRSSDNEVVLDHKSVSRHHARIALVGDEGYLLEDLNSNNGTFLDGGAVRTPKHIRGGERIEIGEVTLEVSLASRALVADPPPPVPAPPSPPI